MIYGVIIFSLRRGGETLFMQPLQIMILLAVTAVLFYCWVFVIVQLLIGDSFVIIRAVYYQVGNLPVINIGSRVVRTQMQHLTLK